MLIAEWKLVEEKLGGHFLTEEVAHDDDLEC